MRRTPGPERLRPRAGPAAHATVRLAAWGLVALAAALAGTRWLALSSERDLAHARERLLAGETAAATQALARAHWPGTSRRAAAGLALARAAAGAVSSGGIRTGVSGRASGGPALGDLAFFEPEALIALALGRRDTRAAGAIAVLARASGHPLGALYDAAILFDRGEDEPARRVAESSPVPLASRGLGARLERALAVRAGTTAALVLELSGEPVATQQADGTLRSLGGAGSYASQALARVNALGPPALPSGARALRLSVDLELSRSAMEALGERRGSIVLVDPRTGGVLAAVTDPSTARSEPAAAFEQRREPASIAKLLTTAAAYRAGYDADALVGQMTCTGVERYGGQPLWCPWPAGRLAGLDHALAVSCNVAFANLAMLVGPARLVEEYRKWGFDEAPPALLDAAGRIETLPQGPRQLADLAIGLELSDVTPLHAALLAAVVANGGLMPEPRLVRGTCGALGLEDAPDPLPSPRGVIAPGVAARLAQAMRAVVQYGTGAGLAPPGLELAMKTGTASTPGIGYHVNYVGFAPARDPAIAFCVRVTGRRSSSAIHADAREVAGRLLAAVARRLAGGWPPAAPRNPAPALAPSR